jgi:chromosomal replication initiator protein
VKNNCSVNLWREIRLSHLCNLRWTQQAEQIQQLKAGIIARKADRPLPKLADIKFAVAGHFKISAAELISDRRTKRVVYPRHIAFFLARNLTTKSFIEIGHSFNRDHTTVLHGVLKIDGKVLKDWTVAYDVAHLEAML